MPSTEQVVDSIIVIFVYVFDIKFIAYKMWGKKTATMINYNDIYKGGDENKSGAQCGAEPTKNWPQLKWKRPYGRKWTTHKEIATI